MTTTHKFFSAFIVAAMTALSAHADGLLLVCNKGDRTLSIIDPNHGQLAVVPEKGVTGHEVAASADGKLAFVPIYGSSGVGKTGTDGHLIRVIDLAKRTIVGTVDLGKGLRPHCAVIGPKDHLLYVTTEISNSITVINPNSLEIVGSIPTGQSESHMLAITSNGTRGYTANVGPGTVSVIDIEAKKVLKIIPIAKKTQRIAISPDDKWAFTADQTKPQLAVIDTTKNEVAKWIALPGIGYGAAATPDGRQLIIALPSVSKVAAIDLQKMEVVAAIEVPKTPQETLVRPDGNVAYVSCDASRQVAAFNLEHFRVERMINAGAGADGLAWAEKP